MGINPNIKYTCMYTYIHFTYVYIDYIYIYVYIDYIYICIYICIYIYTCILHIYVYTNIIWVCLKMGSGTYPNDSSTSEDWNLFPKYDTGWWFGTFFYFPIYWE